jgi:hypothetical protein
MYIPPSSYVHGGRPRWISVRIASRTHSAWAFYLLGRRRTPRIPSGNIIVRACISDCSWFDLVLSAVCHKQGRRSVENRSGNKSRTDPRKGVSPIPVLRRLQYTFRAIECLTCSPFSAVNRVWRTSRKFFTPNPLPNHHLLRSDQRSHTSWPHNIKTRPHGGSRIVITNPRFIPCICIRKPRSWLWLEELQELRWDSSPFQFLTVIQKMKVITDKFLLSNYRENCITKVMCQSGLFSPSNLDVTRAGIHISIFSKIALWNVAEFLKVRTSIRKFAGKYLHFFTVYNPKATCQVNSNETADHINVWCSLSSWTTLWNGPNLSYIEI